MPLWYNLRVKDFSGRNSVDIANAIYETGKFASAFPSFTFDAIEISYDSNVYEQWGLYNSQYEGFDISLSPAWSYATGRGIKVAVIDQGIDMNHQDLRDNIYSRSYDTETRRSPSKVYGDHGTHCAGIVAAVRNNGIQVTGVAPDAKLISVSNRLLSVTNMEANLANGINWAWQNGADVISCSWWCVKNELLEEAIDNAVTKGREGKGCVFVKSAGNTSGAISYPGDYSQEVLSIANMSIDGSLNRTSGYGPNLFVTAPGTAILSTIPGDKVTKMTGTSMACPHVAGLAALILERNPSLTAKLVREIIAKSTKKVGNIPYSTNKMYGSWNEKYGYGLIACLSSCYQNSSVINIIILWTKRIIIMKRIMLIGLLSIMAISSSLSGFASGLIPQQCTIGNRPVCYPIVDVGFTFDGPITVVENALATVYSDGKPLVTGILSCSNYTGNKRTQGTAVITFESPLLLPQGKHISL